MKQRSTTPVSRGFAAKSVLVAAAIMMAIATPLSMMPRVQADKYDDKISALQNQVNQYQAEANKLSNQVNSLKAQLAKINVEKSAIETQVKLSEAKYNKLIQQIKETKQKIKDNQDALGSTIADLYVDDSISPIEMLASSQNIGDYVDKQTFRSSIQDQLTQTISTIKDLKTKLEDDKASVEKVLEKQRGQKAQLAAKEFEKQRLIAKTKGSESAYRSLAQNAKSQMESAAAQQRAYYASLQAQSGGGSSGVNSGVVGSFVFDNWSGQQVCGSDGYPYCGDMDTYGDPWALLNRECVSYAAWKIDQGYNKKVIPFNWNGTPHGYAYEWLDYAKGAVRTYDPQPGDAVVLPPMSGFAPVGHLMVVEGKSGDWVHVSQYNFYGTGEYSTMDIKTSGVVFLRFPSK